ARSRDRTLDRRTPRWRHPRHQQRSARLPHGGHHPRSGRFARAPTRIGRFTVALTSIDDALRRIRRGEMVLVVDDEDRENEGDLTLAAEWVTPEAINFMLRWARGLVCMPCAADRLDRLQFRPMVPARPPRVGPALA